MTKSVKFIGAIVLLLIIISAAALIFILRPSEKTYVQILQNNEVIYSFDLSKEKDRTFRIDFPQGGWNEVMIESGRICICDADCPDHTCVKTGYLRYEGVPIVCLPHKLVIRFSDKEPD